MAVILEGIKKNADFKEIFQTGKTAIGRFVFLKIKKTKTKKSRLGIVVGSKISKKAVERNKIKRRIKAIFKKTYIKLVPGYDIVVVAKKEILKNKYKNIEQDIITIMEKLKITQ